MLELVNVRPDNKGRVLINRFIKKGVSSYDIEAKEDGSLLFIPNVEISLREKDLLQNKELMASIDNGIKDAKEGNTVLLEDVKELLGE